MKAETSGRDRHDGRNIKELRNTMRTLLSTGGLMLAAALTLGRPAQAQSQGAVTITYAFGGFSFTAPTGDAGFRMAATPSPRTLTLLPGVAQTANVQAVYFTVSPPPGEATSRDLRRGPSA